MMGLVRQWLIGVTCTAMLLAIAQGLAPEGGAKKVCRLAGGLALLLSVISPVVQLDETALAQTMTEYQAMVQSYEKKLEGKNVLIYQTIIEDAAAAYIVDKAEEFDILCQAEVTFSYDEDGVPCLWEVTAWGVWTEEQRSQFSRFMEDDLGVPVERQHYEERLP